LTLTKTELFYKSNRENKDMIELSFIFSAFQCGSAAPQAQFQVTVTENNIEYVINQGDTVQIPGVNEVADLDNISYSVVANGSCAISTPVYELAQYGQVLPQVSGAYNQTSLQDFYNQYVTEQYKELLLIELGTTNTSSSVYDLQDIVLKVTTNMAESTPSYPAD
jgi:coenzyme F420-reducing hydrogenase gamma subunit